MLKLRDFSLRTLTRPQVQVLAVVVLALAVRVIAFSSAMHQERFYHSGQDIQTEIGRNVMQGNWLRFDVRNFLAYRELLRNHPTGWVDFNNFEEGSEEDLSSISHVDFGYGVLAGLIWRIWGKIDWMPVICLQIIIDSLMCVLLYFIGQSIGSRRKGLLVAVLFALFPLEIRLAILPHYDIWVSFFYICSVYLLLQEQKQESKWSSLALILGLGILSACTAWVRSIIVLFPVIIGLYLLLRGQSYKWVKVILLLVTFSCAYVIPKAYHTYIDSGEFRITRGTMWFSFYVGLGQFKNDFGMDGTDGSAVSYCVEKDPKLVDKNYFYNWQRYEELLEPRVKEIIRENPLWYVGTVLKRAGVILFPGLYYHKEGVFSFIPVSILLYLKILLMTWSLFFLFGSYIGLRRYFKEYIVILMPYLYTLITISPLFLQGRTMTNIYFIQFLGGVEGLLYLKEKVSINSIHLLLDRVKMNMTK